MGCIRMGDFFFSPSPFALHIKSSDQTEFPACHLNQLAFHSLSLALVSIRKPCLGADCLFLILNLPLSFGVGDRPPEMGFVELGVSWDLGPGQGTGASDYIRIKYVALSSPGRCLPVHFPGEFLSFRDDEVFTRWEV